MLLTYAKPGIDSAGGLRVVYGPLIGRWPASQTISGPWSLGWTNARPLAQPHLALSPAGTVLVAWNGCLTERACQGIIGEGYAHQRVVVAWHLPGRQFGPPTIVRGAPLGSVPQFDGAGAAYLSGRCSATVAIAPAHSRRFSPRVLAREAAKSFTLDLSGAGRGVAAWVAGGCSFDETAPPRTGAVRFSVLRGGAFASPQPLASGAITSSAVAAPGGGLVSWELPAANGAEEPFSAQIESDGLPGAVRQGASAVIPLAADAYGDLVLEPGRAANSYGLGAPAQAPPFVRPAGGGTDQPEPATFGSLAVAPRARRFALAWVSRLSTLELSVWRP